MPSWRGLTGEHNEKCDCSNGWGASHRRRQWKSGSIDESAGVALIWRARIAALAA
jgi:hypothetical protein